MIDALAKGQYPCSIESVSITDNVATSASTGYGIAASGSGDGARADAYAVTAHLTFYERGTLPGTEADASAESTGASAAE